MRAALAALLLAGCYKPGADPACEITCSPASGCPDGLSCVAGRCGEDCASDAGTDGTSRNTDAPADCYGSGDLIVCGVTIRDASDFIFGVDTDNDNRCQRVDIGTTPACVIATRETEVDGGMNTGSRMLVILGERVTIPSSAFVVTSGTSISRGAGQRVCEGGTGSSTGNSGAGGAGGSYVGAGGFGGAGQMDPATSPNPVAAGAFGGCSGGHGGGLTGGGGGGGGGAIAVIATNMITDDGTIFACGGPGLDAQVGGGGGGGSGGSIILIAPAITGRGTRLIAVGGGGGAGSDGTGGSGGSGDICDADGIAGGSQSMSSGGSGGAGHVFTGPYGESGTAGGGAAGGGGGGGGKGRIEVRSPQASLGNAMIVPPL